LIAGAYSLLKIYHVSLCLLFSIIYTKDWSNKTQDWSNKTQRWSNKTQSWSYKT